VSRLCLKLRALAVGATLAGAAIVWQCPALQAQTQTLTPAQIAQLRNNPDLIRQQLQQSGLSADQIRARLRAGGYPESLLDQYLPGAAPLPEGSTLGSNELQALQALGLPFTLAADTLPLDTGLVLQAAPRSRVFGVDAFRRTTTQFLPTLSGPVPPDYALGPGDQLVLILTGDVEFAYTLSVSREGFVVIPQVGLVFVSNLTLDQLRDVLFTRLGRVYSGVRRGSSATTRFDVSVVNVRANQVYVVGEVTQPGAYQISALGTSLTALYAAGGVTEQANLRHIEVRRNGVAIDTLDLYDYLLRGDTRGDVRLQTGDVVFVPVYQTRVDIEGAVVRPALYELRNSETLADAIAAAGGFLPDADLRSVTVHRVLPAADRGPGPAPRAAILVGLAPAADSTAPGPGVVIPPFGLHDGDSIVVDTVPPLETSHSVTIAGMVRRPGPFPWRPDMTLRDLVNLAGGPLVGADLRLAEVARMPVDRSAGELADTLRVPLDSSYLGIRSTDTAYEGPPGMSFPPAGSAAAFTLAPYDHVLILKQPRFEFLRSVTILGEVLYPGSYALTRKDARLSDLVARAGGVLEATAFVDGARFTRSLLNAGRVNVSLGEALAHPGGPDDLVLQPGDTLLIPEYVPTVRVAGAVVAPGSFQWVEGKGADYYLENAGGFAENADKGRTVVRFANGSARNRSKFLFFTSWPKPGPGSDIFVPTRAPREGTNWLPVVAAIASMLASTASVMIALTRF
jgi:polysaccharide export outer membrane protein